MSEVNQEIKAVIFDFGGVVSKTMFETHALTEIALDLPPNSLTWRGPFDPENDDLWRAMQADEISERDYWHKRTIETAKLIGANWSEMSEFITAARGASPKDVIRPQFLEFIEVAKKQGIRLAVLSNELDLFYGKEFRNKLPFLRDFEVIHDATYTKILKPNPHAYLDCIADLGLEPSECVFIDDQLRNINGAIEVGLKIVHFNVLDADESYQKLTQMIA